MEVKFGSFFFCEFYVFESECYIFFNDDNIVVLDFLFYFDVYDYGMVEFYDVMQGSFFFGQFSIVVQYILEFCFSGIFDV